jgi:hypothetical protein
MKTGTIKRTLSWAGALTALAVGVTISAPASVARPMRPISCRRATVQRFGARQKGL